MKCSGKFYGMQVSMTRQSWDFLEAYIYNSYSQHPLPSRKAIWQTFLQIYALERQSAITLFFPFMCLMSKLEELTKTSNVVMLTLVSNILFQKWSSSFDFCWTSWRNNKLDVPYLHLFTEKCWCSLCNESHFSQGLFYLVENVLWNQTCRKLTYIHTCITFISVSSRSSTKALIGDTQTQYVTNLIKNINLIIKYW